MIIRGDVLTTGLPDEYATACLCDPPYGLSFMGKGWDHGVPGVAYWREVWRVLKPGAVLMAFSGTRTHHRLYCAIEDAGFELVDTIAWIFGSGFPKSRSLTRDWDLALPENLRCVCGHRSRDRAASSQSDCQPGHGLCDGQLLSVQDNVPGVPPLPSDARGHTRDGLREDDLCKEQEHNLGHLSSDRLSIEDCATLLERLSTDSQCAGNKLSGMLENTLRAWLTEHHKMDGHKSDTQHSGGDSVSSLPYSYPPIPSMIGIYHKCRNCQKYYATEGYGTALKPAIEFVCLARKPRPGTYAACALEHGTGALNIDGGRIGYGDEPIPDLDHWRKTSGGWKNTSTAGVVPNDNSKGRWPANLILDPASAVMVGEQSGVSKSSLTARDDARQNRGESIFLDGQHGPQNSHSDSGTAARFFYCAKAARGERDAGLEGREATTGGGMSGTADHSLKTGSGNQRNNQMRNPHPTVKPLDLCRYLATLLRPPEAYLDDAVLLVPFSGSGSEMIGGYLAGWRNVTGIERSDEYADIAEARVSYWRDAMESTQETDPKTILKAMRRRKPAPLFEEDNRNG